MSNDPNGAIPARPAIDLAEYDFSEVPDSELEACRYYEYLRESEGLVGEINRLKPLFKDKVCGKALRAGRPLTWNVWHTKAERHSVRTIEAIIVTKIAGRRNCPESPWQRLSKEDREVLKEFPKRAIELEEDWLMKLFPALVLEMPATKNAALSRLKLRDWAKKSYGKLFPNDGEGLEDQIVFWGFFQIFKSFSHARLIEAFRAWLVEHHPKGAGKPKVGRGRNIVRDRLNALGALRLRYHCRTLNEAQQLIAPLKMKPKGMRYSDRTAWNRACETAIQEFQTLLQPPPGHRPIHYTEGWQKLAGNF